ncbi:MAG: hypothetical protein NWE96_04715 [Candidatus Bathyarchaeota archaeon]|nr:hypothetical protein [Candidatus Bathyarchaeota archaeon]
MIDPSFVSASIPKPSVPQFTVKLIDSSYYIPASTSVDPYTGAEITNQGYHVVNRTIELSIKNKPFTAYESDGQIINYYLNIRTKGNYDKDWIIIYSPSKGYLTQSNSDYTTVVYSLDDNEYPFWDNIKGEGTIDFQVQALIGSVHRVYNGSAAEIMDTAPWIFEGETSDWSSTQTITVPEPTQTAVPSASQSSTSPTVNPTVSQVFGLDWVGVVVVVLLGVVVVLFVFVVFYSGKRRGL